MLLASGCVDDDTKHKIKHKLMASATSSSLGIFNQKCIVDIISTEIPASVTIFFSSEWGWPELRR